LREKLRALPVSLAAVPFREIQGIARGRRRGLHGTVARGLPADALEQDPGLAGKLVFESGSFSLEDRSSIVLGAELARRLDAVVGDWISLVSVSADMEDLFADETGADPGTDNAQFQVTGIFRSGFYEYDLGWAFINLERSGETSGAPEDLALGIKLKNRWQDRLGMEQARSVLAANGRGDLEVFSWRDYNRAFFGALRTEKLFMFVLVGLIFIVVGLNIFQAQRRAVLERREEIGLLRAVGATGMAVRLIFVWDGFIIGMAGASLGMSLGVLIARNIGPFFTLLEGAVNFFITLLNLAASLFSGTDAAGGSFAIFSPTVFYIKEIPSRLIPHEALIVFLFGFLSALAAAWFASGKASRIQPAEALRYE
jgi:lipoprotein-releasing system permease protein